MRRLASSSHPHHQRDQFGLPVDIGFREDDLQLRSGGLVRDSEMLCGVAEIFTGANEAEQRGIAYETARSQRSAMVAKTDVHRQAELVGLMTRMT